MTDHDERDPTSAEEPQDAVPTPPEGVAAEHDAAQKDAAQEPGAQPGPESGSKRGAMRYQDPETTVAREPTLGERRARDQARKREREAAEAAVAEGARKRKKRKRVLIGAGVTVGVAAVAAIGYAASQPDEVVARCVDENDVVVDDNICATGQEVASSNSGYGGGGGFFPIFIGGGGRQYHYNYGGAGDIGQRASGGTTVAPNNANVRTPSGSSVSRGGFGVSKGGSSSGGSSSGGSSSGS